MFTFRILPGGVYEITSAFQIKTEVYPSRAASTPHASIQTSGELLILPGFEWDGPSGPAIDTASFMKASCVHDCLYGMIANHDIGQDKKERKYLRKAADYEMRKIAKADGMSAWRCWYTWAGVRLFGWRHV